MSDPKELFVLARAVLSQRQRAGVEMAPECRAVLSTIANWLDALPGNLTRTDVVKLLLAASNVELSDPGRPVPHHGSGPASTVRATPSGHQES